MAVTYTHPRLARTQTQRVLVVADWSVDPQAVIATLAARAAETRTVYALVVPAWLHGLDWAGDPYASGACASRMLASLLELGAAAGLEVDVAVVGDPHPVTAVSDTCATVECDVILLCTRRRRLTHGHPLDLAHRMHAATGLPVIHEPLPSAGGGHCEADLPLAA